MSSYNQDSDPIDGPSIYLRVSSGNYPQRQSYKNPILRPESFNDGGYSESYRLSHQPNSRKSLAKLNDFRKRVHEVVDLCRGENNEVKGEINQVIGEERKIYDMLNENPNYLRRTVSYQSFPQQNVSYGQGGQGSQQRREQLTTPFRPLKNLPQSQYYVPGASQVGLRQTTFQPNIAQSNLIRPDSGYLPQGDMSPYYGTFGPDSAPQNLQGSFLKLKNTKQIHLNEDALRLIEDIERKAFEQIQRLRKQKLQLMQRLNVQIRNVNEQKRKNTELQSVLSRYSGQPQRPDGSSDLQAQIARLQADLQRANQLNHNLRLELGSRGSGVPGIEELLRQGEAIRQETLRLLKLKEQGETGQRIAELERMLEAQRAQKQTVLNEVKVLRERQGGQSISVRQQGQSTYPSLDKSSARGRQSNKPAAQYEDLVAQMKRITGF